MPGERCQGKCRRFDYATDDLRFPESTHTAVRVCSVLPRPFIWRCVRSVDAVALALDTHRHDDSRSSSSLIYVPEDR